MMKINFVNKTNNDISAVENLIIRLFESLDHAYKMTYIFVDDVAMQALNNQYRAINKITDVISFPTNEGHPSILQKDIGDVFICIDQAKRQATDYQHSWEREIGFLAVHGFLHLLGFDHETEIEAHHMEAMQELILSHVKLERKINL